MDSRICTFMLLIISTSIADDNNDGRVVCMNLLGKYWEVEETPTQDPGSLSRTHINGRNLFQTADLDDPCDMTLYVDFIKPIYESANRKDELAAIDKLNKHLENHQQLVNVSCFGLTNSSRGRFYKCHQNETGSAVCICMDEHPWLFQRVSKDVDDSECSLIYSQIGDPCDWTRQQFFNEKLYQPHYEAMKDADAEALETEKALIKYGKDLMENCQWGFSMGDVRSLCLGITTNLECKNNNKCDCLDVTPYYSFKRKSGTCLAKRGTTCLFEPKTKDGTPILLRSSRCADKLDCTDPLLQPEFAEFDFHAFQVCGGTKMCETNIEIQFVTIIATIVVIRLL